MKKYLFTMLVLLFVDFSISNEIYKLVNVYIPDAKTLEKLISTGIDMEGSSAKVGNWFEVTISESELKALQVKGFETHILIDDLTKFYSERLVKGPYDALGFGLGSMGGYYTLNEVIKQLDTMRLLYPNLITERFVVGYSLQDRPIWGVKISKNADLQLNKPEAFYNSLTHAREPAGLMSVMYFMWYLLQNYGTNPEVTYIVDNRNLYFVPVVNPDGYEANRRFAPNGGGMRRKNMRSVVNDNDSYGVDLNRNFGYMWGYDNSGSSPSPTAETYRGTSAFSEPETQSLKVFCEGRNFKFALNYHTYSNLLIYPWGYIGNFETPDSAIFREYAKDMTKYNNYLFGTGNQTVGYTVNGSADDWMYGERITKNKIFSMTPEVGRSSDGFWPASNRILPLAQENLFPNLYVANIAGSYTAIQQISIQDSSGDGFLSRGEKFNLLLNLRNKGQDSAYNVSVQLKSSSSALSVPIHPVSCGAIGPLSSKIISLACSVSSRAPSGVIINLFAKITENSGRILLDTIPLYIGNMNIVFSDSANAGTSNWSTGVSWGVSQTNHTPPASFTDSPVGNYLDSTDNSLTLLNSANISGATRAILKFWAKWDIETKWDFVTLEVSSNGGNTWNPLQGKYTKTASGSGVQLPLGIHGYDGLQNNWVEEEFNVTPYSSTNFKFRFRLRSDGSIPKDGFYVDGIVLSYITKDTMRFVDIECSPAEVIFGDTHVNANKEVTLLLKNLSISTDTLKGAIQLGTSSAFNFIGNNNFSIPVNGVRQIVLRFSPSTIGLFRDTLLISHNATILESPLKVPVSGNGIFIFTPKFLSELIIKNGFETDTLKFGSVSGATDGIDILYGESELPSLTSNDIFDVRWNIQGTNGTKLDLKDTLSMSRPLNYYTNIFQPGILGYPIKFYWNKSILPGGIFAIKDVQTGGNLINVNMRTIDSLIVTNPAVKGLFIAHQSAEVSVDNSAEVLPQEYELYANYPNPFNPVTNIKFQIPELSTVNLRIINVLGQEVKMLLSDIKQPGRYEVTWDGTNNQGMNISSGIYFYKIEAASTRSSKNPFISLKKLILMK